MKYIMKFRKSQYHPWEYYEDTRDNCIEYLKQIVKKDGCGYEYAIELYQLVDTIEKGKIKYADVMKDKVNDNLKKRYTSEDTETIFKSFFTI